MANAEYCWPSRQKNCRDTKRLASRPSRVQRKPNRVLGNWANWFSIFFVGTYFLFVHNMLCVFVAIRCQYRTFSNHPCSIDPHAFIDSKQNLRQSNTTPIRSTNTPPSTGGCQQPGWWGGGHGRLQRPILGTFSDRYTYILPQKATTNCLACYGTLPLRKRYYWGASWLG